MWQTQQKYSVEVILEQKGRGTSMKWPSKTLYISGTSMKQMAYIEDDHTHCKFKHVAANAAATLTGKMTKLIQWRHGKTSDDLAKYAHAHIQHTKIIEHILDLSSPLTCSSSWNLTVHMWSKHNSERNTLWSSTREMVTTPVLPQYT